MRESCNESVLMEALKTALRQECGKPEASFDDAMEWWKKTCGVKLCGSVDRGGIRPVFLSAMEAGQKFPGDVFVRYPEVEKRMGVRSLRCSARKSSSFRAQETIRVTGEFQAAVDEEGMTLMILVFNGSSELMGYAERAFVRSDQGTLHSFDETIFIPGDEQVSAIGLRFTTLPNLFSEV